MTMMQEAAPLIGFRFPGGAFAADAPDEAACRPLPWSSQVQAAVAWQEALADASQEVVPADTRPA